MNQLVVFAGGMAALAVSTVARHYSMWLLRQVLDGVVPRSGYRADLAHFCRVLAVDLAAEWVDRRFRE